MPKMKLQSPAASTWRSAYLSPGTIIGILYSERKAPSLDVIPLHNIHALSCGYTASIRPVTNRHHHSNLIPSHQPVDITTLRRGSYLGTFLKGLGSTCSLVKPPRDVMCARYPPRPTHLSLPYTRTPHFVVAMPFSSLLWLFKTSP